MFDLRLAYLKPVLGFEPLPVSIQQGDERDGNVTGLCGDKNEIVEGLLIRCVEHHEVCKRPRPLCRPEIGSVGG